MDNSNNNKVRDEEFSLLFNVEHSHQRKIRLHKVHLPRKQILDASFSETHSIVVISGSLVYTWGLEHFENAFTNNFKNPNNTKYPVCVNYLRNKNIIKCAAGNGFSIFLNQDGVVFSCGFGNRGCLGRGDLSNNFTPTIISSILAVNVKQISCGVEHVLAISDCGALHTWGSSLYGQLGQGKTKIICCSPKEVFTPAKVEKAYGSEDASLLLLINQKILVCGSNRFCKIGFPSSCKKLSTFRVLKNVENGIINVTLNRESTVLLCENGFVLVMGKCGNKIYTHPQRIFLPYTNLYTIGLGSNFLTFATDKLVNMIYFDENGFDFLDSEKQNFSCTSTSKLSHQCSYDSSNCSNKSMSVESTGSTNSSKGCEQITTSYVKQLYCIGSTIYVLIHTRSDT